jgi:hypothetical protein
MDSRGKTRNPMKSMAGSKKTASRQFAGTTRDVLQPGGD